MKTFGISKSTALRDIEALKNLGVPLYVENGRYGGYRVLNKPLFCRMSNLFRYNY